MQKKPWWFFIFFLEIKKKIENMEKVTEKLDKLITVGNWFDQKIDAVL